MRLDRHATTLDVPRAPGLKYLLDHPETDGRSVVDADNLLRPTNPLLLPDPAFANGTSSPQKRDIALADLLEPRQPGICQGLCASVADCFSIGCYACYFPSGPGYFGICFIN